MYEFEASSIVRRNGCNSFYDCDTVNVQELTYICMNIMLTFFYGHLTYVMTAKQRDHHYQPPHMIPGGGENL